MRKRNNTDMYATTLFDGVGEIDIVFPNSKEKSLFLYSQLVSQIEAGDHDYIRAKMDEKDLRAVVEAKTREWGWVGEKVMKREVAIYLCAFLDGWEQRRRNMLLEAEKHAIDAE